MWKTILEIMAWYLLFYSVIYCLVIFDGPVEATIWSWLTATFQRIASLFGQAAIACELAYGDAMNRYRLS